MRDLSQELLLRLAHVQSEIPAGLCLPGSSLWYSTPNIAQARLVCNEGLEAAVSGRGLGLQAVLTVCDQVVWHILWLRKARPLSFTQSLCKGKH